MWERKVEIAQVSNAMSIHLSHLHRNTEHVVYVCLVCFGR